MLEYIKECQAKRMKEGTAWLGWQVDHTESDRNEFRNLWIDTIIGTKEVTATSAGTETPVETTTTEDVE